MPNVIFPVPEFHPAPSRSAPSLAVRVWTRLRRNRLDQELALGADPGGSASLDHRAAQLQSRGDDMMVTVVLPEFLPRRWWQHLLHNQTALLVKGALLFRRNLVVADVPYLLKR